MTARRFTSKPDLDGDYVIARDYTTSSGEDVVLLKVVDNVTWLDKQDQRRLAQFLNNEDVAPRIDTQEITDWSTLTFGDEFVRSNGTPNTFIAYIPEAGLVVYTGWDAKNHAVAHQCLSDSTRKVTTP